MMIQAVLSNPSHPEYGVATIPFPIPRDQYAHCIAYKGYISMEEVMNGSQSSHMEMGGLSR